MCNLKNIFKCRKKKRIYLAQNLRDIFMDEIKFYALNCEVLKKRKFLYNENNQISNILDRLELNIDDIMKK
jgi:hypothetical protein